MKGAIIGDIVGSVYEFHTIKQKDFKFYKPKCYFTDDTVMTLAVAKAGLEYLEDGNIDVYKQNVIKNMQEMGRKYPNAGYGYNFDEWIKSDDPKPYNSFGNGGAMRTSSCAYIASSLEEAEMLAKAQAEVSHNHPEGIKGAKALTACIFLAKSGYSKEDIMEYIKENYYDINFKIPEIYRKYKYDITAQGSVPYSIEAFMEGENFEDSIRNVISLGGDADTLGAMTGAISEAYYGIPREIERPMYSYLPDEFNDLIDNFYETIKKKEMNKGRSL